MIAQWHAYYRSGADHRALLNRSFEQCRDMPQEIWICLADRSQFDKELERLDELNRTISNRKELIQRFPLFGIPFAAKDNIDVAGQPTSAACPAFSKMATHATSVARLREAGAICMGKANLDQCAIGLVGTRSPHGRPASVFNSRHVSGGSSSGSAVAVPFLPASFPRTRSKREI